MSNRRALQTLMRKRVRAFIDGIADIYRVRDDDLIESVQKGIRFQALTVGSQRFFAAKDHQHSVDKMICVPECPEPEANMVAVISGRQYDILQVQEIRDSFPRTWQISLERIKENNEHGVFSPAPAPAVPEGGEGV